ncbi:NADPH-ferrihemoprotein reductase [Rhizoctonia solani]|uniref:NADPH-ferrihemoprotein reductase n=1 Tax=Rhizoctonia solani TaxID=456999 RepID=A0A8H8T171_9AGAM|nr:NADPH-ferrihemoprotein reductase [Rhizoctonia solani]QRW25499.1 NADPH-ferrihemoprotein reductase [Rhizoctonia solani]
MRAMIEERVAKGATDWEAYQKRGVLVYRLAASRDQERKIYVQELITNDSKEVKERLVDRKGSLYISGSSNQMPSGVRKAVIASLRDECGWTDDESASYVDRMEMEGDGGTNPGDRTAPRLIKSATSSTRSISNPPDASSAVRQTLSLFDSPTSNYSSEPLGTPSTPSIDDSLASHQDKIKEMEARIQAIEQHRGSLSPATSSTRSISIHQMPPLRSDRLSLFDSPTSNYSSEPLGTPSTPSIDDSLASLLESDFTPIRVQLIPSRSSYSCTTGWRRYKYTPRLVEKHRRGLTGYKLHTGRVLYNLSKSSEPVLALLYVILLAYYYFKSRMLEAHVILTAPSNSPLLWDTSPEFALYWTTTPQYRPSQDLARALATSGLNRTREAIIFLASYFSHHDDICDVKQGMCCQRFGWRAHKWSATFLAPEDITTVWPISLSDFIQYVVADVSQDNPACLLIKALILVYYAGKLIPKDFQGLSLRRNGGHDLDNVIAQ